VKRWISNIGGLATRTRQQGSVFVYTSAHPLMMRGEEVALKEVDCGKGGGVEEVEKGCFQ
jgi:hypothetical protein